MLRISPGSIPASSLFILAAMTFSALAQPPADPEEPAAATATDTEADEGDAEDDSDALSPELSVPEVPETTVVGRPDPFPAAPLGEDTVLSASRTEGFGSHEGSSLTVITEQQLRDLRQGRLSEALRGVPGVDVVEQGGTGRQTSVFLRGANSNHTKVMVDGIPVNDPTTPQRGFDFSLLSVDDVQQIEVLRGPQSTLWGSDAIGGVVNITTKRGEGPMKVRAGFDGGSFGTSRESLNVSGGTSRYHYSFGGSYLNQAGFSAAADGTEKDGFSGATFAGRTGWTPADNFDVDYSFRYIDQLVDFDGFDFATGRPGDNLSQQQWQAFFNRVQARLATLDDCWEHRVAFNLSDHDRRYMDEFFPGRFQGVTTKFEYLSLLQLTENNVLTAGVDYWNESTDRSAAPDASQSMTGVYVHDRIRLWDRWFTTIGFRRDEHSRAGGADTYRISSRYNVAEMGPSFHGSIGTGFRAPTIYELFDPYSGNANLNPERSFGWDCGVEQSLFCGDLVVDGTYFRNDFTDLIEWVWLGGFNGLYRNVGNAMSSGVEVTARWNMDRRTDVFGSYVHTLTRNQDTGDPLLRRPKHKASVGVLRRFACDRASLGCTLHYVGPRFDVGGIPLSEYYLMKVTGGYQLTNWCEAFVRLDNVLDDEYEEVYGYNVAPFSAFGGLNIRL